MAAKSKKPAPSKMAKSKAPKKEVKKELKKVSKKEIKVQPKKVVAPKMAKASGSKKIETKKVPTKEIKTKANGKLDAKKLKTAPTTDAKKVDAKTAKPAANTKKTKVVARAEAIKKYKAQKGKGDNEDDLLEESLEGDEENADDIYEKDFADKELDDFEHLGDEGTEEVIEEVEEDEEGNFGSKRREANRQLEEYNPDEDHEETPDTQHTYGWGYSDTFDKPDEVEESKDDELDEDELYARGVGEEEA